MVIRMEKYYVSFCKDMDRLELGTKKTTGVQGEETMGRQLPSISFAVTNLSRTGLGEQLLGSSGHRLRAAHADTHSSSLGTGHTPLILAPLLLCGGGGWAEEAMGSPSHLTMKPGAQVQLPVARLAVSTVLARCRAAGTHHRSSQQGRTHCSGSQPTWLAGAQLQSRGVTAEQMREG